MGEQQTVKALKVEFEPEIAALFESVVERFAALGRDPQELRAAILEEALQAGVVAVLNMMNVGVDLPNVDFDMLCVMVPKSQYERLIGVLKDLQIAEPKLKDYPGTFLPQGFIEAALRLYVNWPGHPSEPGRLTVEALRIVDPTDPYVGKPRGGYLRGH